LERRIISEAIIIIIKKNNEEKKETDVAIAMRGWPGQKADAQASKAHKKPIRQMKTQITFGQIKTKQAKTKTTHDVNEKPQKPHLLIFIEKKKPLNLPHPF